LNKNFQKIMNLVRFKIKSFSKLILRLPSKTIVRFKIKSNSKLTLRLPSKTIVLYTNKLDPDETSSILVSHPDPCCLTL